MLIHRQGQAIETTWPISERLLVCVGPSPTSAKLVRAAKRMAAELHADWFAVLVETPDLHRLSEQERQRAIQNLRLAEQLGAKTRSLIGRTVAEEVLAFARAHNVNKIIIGKPIQSRWRELLSPSPVDRLVRSSGDIDIYVIRGDQEKPAAPYPEPPKAAIKWPAYLMAILLCGLCAGVADLMFGYFHEPNLIMVYLLGVVIAALRYGRGPAVLLSVLSVLSFDFFFTTPYYTLAVENTEYFITFGVMLVVALVISHLVAVSQSQTAMARQRERHTAALHALSQQLATTRNADKLVRITVQHLSELLESQVLVLLPDENGRLVPSAGNMARIVLEPKEESVVQWVFKLGQTAGQGTQTLPFSEFMYVCLLGLQGPVGVLGIRTHFPKRQFSTDQMLLLDSSAKLLALALEVDRLESATLKSRMEVEAERMRSSLLSSVTHDLQTPLAAIMGSASSILELSERMPVKTRREMTENIYREADRLSRFLANLLRMTVLETGAHKLKQESQPLEEVLGAVLNRLEKELADRPVIVDLPEDLPLVRVDSLLAEQLFMNLIENAIKYSPSGTPITVTASVKEDMILVEIADQGPGLPEEDLTKVFQMFYRSDHRVDQRGYGLGLAICQAIVKVHGGTIRAENRPGGPRRDQTTASPVEPSSGGLAIKFTLPRSLPADHVEEPMTDVSPGPSIK
ncbi:MAG: DUF4118 domain-containing protein [Thermodesulfobacteriota bacterium]